MNQNRRDFLKISGVAGLGFAGSGLLAGCATTEQQPRVAQVANQVKRKYTQRFNMSGYSAPRLDKVRIACVGLGMRGPGAVSRLSCIEGVEIKALCDLVPERAEKVKQALKEQGTAHDPVLYSGKPDSWKAMFDRDDIDLVYITTPWSLHAPQALYAMEHGKHAAVEVPAATTIEQCWQLVETSERTKKHCMMLENCCYDFFELLTLNMARQGYFGEIVHAEGAYIHGLLDLNLDKAKGYQDMWRLKENMTRNGNLYPTHGLGPICQLLNVNRGDAMDYLTSVQTKDFQMFEEVKRRAATDSFYSQFARDTYRGNMNTTTICTKKGKTMMVQHDVTTPRPYSRIHLVSGTKGCASKYPVKKIAAGHSWVSEEELTKLEAQYTPDIVKRIGEMAKTIGGHGGMDFMMDWRLIDCLRNGLPLDQDVYDAASWSSVGPLSEWSVANRSNSIDVPDFTAGAWQTNAPVTLTLAGGGTTNVISK
ncbi:Gfo/Idh/MocA family oxidoreductase (plasmid) [Hymenobacter tibetensis]|uniref:Gfo/Idh/MocA family oxidoreductase n=1 Tax=Hymenobacter tibetensis TaxID=497967 RepID=A0ABY4D8E3_9BACT|nr:Gfo/Idh/MocA family oxidoreductase [Hymenobacter tibetensis]UOG77459.1 Gfo/Idh/MocA family oxidoreductase [Hymenobacter tibetensis]